MWRRPSLRLRLVGFGFAVASVAFLIIRIDTNIWRAQAHLEEGFADIKAEKFYSGINFRGSLRRLSDALLDYRLTANPDDLETFQREARALQDWLEVKQAAFVGRKERDAFVRLKVAYGKFLTRVNRLAQPNGSITAGPDGFAAAYAQLKRDYQPALMACENVAQAEHEGFDAFLLAADGTLRSLQRLFVLSLLLLVALAGALALLVYRGMLAPLRAQLNESQALMARQEKLALLGALGAGVAHEIRNPLTAIKFRLFSLKKSLPPEFADNEDARTIAEEINRLDRIVKEFLQFARPSEPDRVRLPAGQILQDLRDLMRSELESIGIELKLEDAPPAWTFADSHQLKQVLINLVQNSADSIGKNGVITLSLRTEHGALAGDKRPAIVLSVRDTGQGIPLEVQKRLFDPFFTTKECGTGLGLAIAARIVEKHGGVLRYRTEVNRGTTFDIVLPGAGDPATEQPTNRS